MINMNEVKDVERMTLRLKREIRLMRSLKHENIVEYLERKLLYMTSAIKCNEEAQRNRVGSIEMDVCFLAILAYANPYTCDVLLYTRCKLHAND